MDYAENICVAIDQIVTAKLQDLSYDVTKLCQIVDNSEKDKGKYIVQEGTSKFEAYSTDTSLRVGSSVLVTIPNGDYNMQKIIAGKATSEATTPFVYSSPLDTIITAIDDLGEAIDDAKILANNNAVMVKKIATIVPNNDEFVGFTRLGVSALFQSWLSSYNVISGEYGLKFLLYSDTNVTELVFGTKDMYGNPYQFDAYFLQEKVFDISSINKIDKIEAYFYQNSDFINRDNEPIPYSYYNEELDIIEISPENLFVKDVKMYLGYELGNQMNDTVKASTPNTSTYDSELEQNEQGDWVNKVEDEKTIKLQWIHRGTNNRYSFIDESDLGDSLKVKWYRYEIDAIITDPTITDNWTEITELENKLEFIFVPNVARTFEQIKAVASGFYPNGESFIYYSNILLFANRGRIPSTSEIVSSLSIVFDDETYGNYYLYNQQGKIIDAAQGQGRRRAMRVLYGGEDLSSASGVQEVTWHIPIDNSMIVLRPEYLVDAIVEDYQDIKGKSYKKITRKKNNGIQYYQIFDHWSSTYSNNTIECILKVNDIEYYNIVDLNFGQTVESTTNLYFEINFTDGKNALLAGSQDTLIIEGNLYNASGEKITLYNNADIVWGWKHQTVSNEIEIIRTESTSSVMLKLYSDITGNTPINFNILKATFSISQQEKLVAYLPIPIKSRSHFGYIDGAREVLYNEAGLPQYFRGAYKLFQDNGDRIACNWDITVDNSSIYSPNLKVADDSYGLQVNSTYIAGTSDKVCVVARSRGTNEILWSQPILILQNNPKSEEYNKWDKELILSNLQDSLQPSTFSFGEKKNNDSYFSGVFLGQLDNNTEILSGLYGVRNGEITYALKQDGSLSCNKVANFCAAEGNYVQSANYITVEQEYYIYNNERYNVFAYTYTQPIVENENFVLDANGNISLETNTDYYTRNTTNNKIYTVPNSNEPTEIIFADKKQYYIQSSLGANGALIQTLQFYSGDALETRILERMRPVVVAPNNQTRLDLDNGKLYTTAPKIIMYNGQSVFDTNSLTFGNRFIVNAQTGELICNNVKSLNNDGRDDMFLSVGNKFYIDNNGNVGGKAANLCAGYADNYSSTGTIAQKFAAIEARLGTL